MSVVYGTCPMPSSGDHRVFGMTNVTRAHRTSPRGDHHIFEKPGVHDPINIQPTSEAKVKPYQVRQIRQLLLDYNIEP